MAAFSFLCCLDTTKEFGTGLLFPSFILYILISVGSLQSYFDHFSLVSRSVFLKEWCED